MKCNDVRDRLSAYLDQEISPEMKVTIKEHLRNCNDCDGECNQMAKTTALLTLLGEQTPDASFRQTVMNALSEKPSWVGFRLYRHPAQVLVAVATLVIIIVCACLVYL